MHERHKLTLSLRVQHLRLDEIQRHAWRIQGASAVSGDQVSEGIDWLIHDVATRVHYYGANS